MNAIQSVAIAPAAAAVGFACAALLLGAERRREVFAVLVPLAGLAPLALIVSGLHPLTLTSAGLAVGLVVALLARDPNDLLHSECALKLLWVLATALALSWAGLELLSLATGSAHPPEQWAVLDLGLDRPFLWSTALPLSLVVGFVLLGIAPFHFWIGDLLQGARAWLAPLAVVALQATGARWLTLRTDGIQRFAEAESIASGVFEIAALVGLIGGAATLVVQRRPERRVATLVSLQGALVLASFAGAHGPEEALSGLRAGTWIAHGLLAVTGAGLLARLLPVPSGAPEQGAQVFRRHPFAALAGFYALLSLAGAPGTPGAGIWLEAAGMLAARGFAWTLLALAGAWLAAFAVAVQMGRDMIGRPSPTPVAPTPTPFGVRATLWSSAGALVWLAFRGP